jgi:hypothetical protein
LCSKVVKTIGNKNFNKCSYLLVFCPAPEGPIRDAWDDLLKPGQGLRMFAVYHAAMDNLVVIGGSCLCEGFVVGVLVFPKEVEGVAVEHLFEVIEVLERHRLMVSVVFVDT